MFKWLYKLLGSMLGFFSSITGSYVLALLFYALIFKIVFIPFGIKQQKNQIKMAKLAPKIQLIKAKYKGRTDQRSMQKQQQEIMELQQKEGYNGCSGCMPLLIQLPIIMLLYAVIQSPLTYMAKEVETDDITAYNENYNKADYKEENIPESILEMFDSNPDDGVRGDLLYERDKNGEFVITNGSRGRVEITKDVKVKALYAMYGLDSTEKKTNEISIISKMYEKAYYENPETGETGYDTETARIARRGIDFESVPNFRFFNTSVNLAETPSFKAPSIILIIPFLAAISSWLTMFLTRKMNGNTNPAAQGANDQAQKSMLMMDLMMPMMTLFFAFNFSGMLGLYWIIQSALGLLQTFIISRTMPIPHFTEEELRELRRQEKEIEKAARAAAKETRHRSLHYIDEDDYDELPEAPQSENAKKSSGLGTDAPEIKD